MSARTPRRSFATPFIITLAACGGSQQQPPPPSPPPSNPPPPEIAPTPGPPTDPSIHWNPPPPADNTPPTQNPPPPQADSKPPPVVHRNPPAPGHDHSDGQQWTVKKQGDKCIALADNPQRSIDYACPAGLSLDKPIKVMASGERCIVLREPSPCPPHAMCNPPPPHVVPCPE